MMAPPRSTAATIDRPHRHTCRDPDGPEPDLETVDRDEAWHRSQEHPRRRSRHRPRAGHPIPVTTPSPGLPSEVYHWGLDQADVHAIADRYTPGPRPHAAAQQDARAQEVADRAAASSRSAAADDSDWREW